MPPEAKPRRQPPPRVAPKTNETTDSPTAPAAKESLAPGKDQQSEPLGADGAGTSKQPLPHDAVELSQLATTTAANPSSLPRRRRASLLSRKIIAPSEPSDSRSAGLKYQPRRYVRRSKDERAAAEKAEAEKRQQRVAEGGIPVSSSSNRGAFQGRGGRGSYSGPMSKGEASGHLGGSSIEEGGRKKSVRGGGLFSRLSIPSTSTTTKAAFSKAKNQAPIKSERDRDGDVVMGTSMTGRRQMIKGEGLTNVSSDEEPDPAEGPRVNIEHINLLSDDDADGNQPEVSNQDKGKEHEKEIKIPGWTLKPIRIDRHDHIERAAGIKTDISSLTSAELRRRAKERENAEEGLFISDDDDEPAKLETSKAKGREKPKDVEFVRDERRWQGVYQDDDDRQANSQIKPEPKDDDGFMVLDNVAAANWPTSSLQADSGALVPERIESGVSENPYAEHILFQKENKRSPRTKSRLFKPILQTEEDQQEWVRYEEDLRILGDELGSMKTDVPQTHPLDWDGGLNIDEEPPEDAKDRREGLVYLFQLPPIMPRLLSAAEKEAPKSKAKEIVEEQGSQDTKPRDPKPVVTDPRPKQPETEETPPPEMHNPNVFMAEDPARPKGRVGKLRVHDTGRVTVTWGGASLELNRGGGSGLLQEVVMTDYERSVVKIAEGGKEKEGKERWERRISLGEKMWAVGQLGGGFVMVPDWENMLGS